jgi:DEAD_2
MQPSRAHALSCDALLPEKFAPPAALTRACEQVHDIEDLVKAGKQKVACPYFAARALAETAELVFCPYNYIIDPQIRASVSISLTVRHLAPECWSALCCTMPWPAAQCAYVRHGGERSDPE